jgi:hypothetical protein
MGNHGAKYMEHSPKGNMSYRLIHVTVTINMRSTHQYTSFENTGELNSLLIDFLDCSRIKQTPWSESGSELYRPNDRRLSAKLMPTFADIGCHVVSVTDPYSRILDFLDRSHYFSFK